jgi:hypothetical protein
MATSLSVLSPDDWERAGGAVPDLTDLRAELDRKTITLEKAQHVPRTIRKLDVKPEKPEGLEDDPIEPTVIAYATLLAKIHARIDLYNAGARRS